MSRTRDPEATRRRVLGAAAVQIARHGAGVSLETVATAARVSKGGLLHHFPTKEALIEQLVSALFEDFAALVRERAAADPGPGSLARGYIAATFDDLARELDPELEPPDDLGHLSAGLYALLVAQLAGVASAVRQFRADDARWQRELVADGLAAGTVRVILAATDGACLTSGLLDVSSTETEALRNDLIALTRSEPAAAPRPSQ